MVLDLHVLPIHGPDVKLGLAWLKALHHVTSDYDVETLEFHSRGRSVCLKVTPRSPRRVSASTLASIMLHQEAAKCFEIVPVEAAGPDSNDVLELPADIPTSICDAIMQHASVFAVPS